LITNDAYRDLDDGQLCVLIKNGDHRAFSEVFERYTPLLYIHAYKKLRNDTEAKDVVQETFIRLWNKRALLDEGNNLSGYLYRSVMNRIFNLMDHQKIVDGYAKAFNINLYRSHGSDHLVREKQLKELIEKEINRLPPRMREVFELRRNEHLSNKQVAEQLNISESTVADQMKKALKLLRSRLGMKLIF
jgi:RNA polymerase sigma-70 factor (ECF subfamily)